MARAKTAVLLAAACRVGAILGGGDAPTTELLGDFGDHLGICFQIRDDVLPYDPIAARAMGKPSDSDVRNRCPTLPVLIAHRRADPESRAALRHALLDETEPALALCRIRAVLERTGALDTAHAMADDYARRAANSSPGCPPPPTWPTSAPWRSSPDRRTEAYRITQEPERDACAELPGGMIARSGCVQTAAATLIGVARRHAQH